MEVVCFMDIEFLGGVLRPMGEVDDWATEERVVPWRPRVAVPGLERVIDAVGKIWGC